MKISRQKKVQRFLSFYINNFGFRPPFQLLIDGTYCFMALKNKHDIKDNLPKYFHNELKFLTTPCIITETEKLGKKAIGTMLVVKQFAVHKCEHVKNPVSGSECIKSMIGKKNPNRYIIATQDRDLQRYINAMAGVPLLYLHQKTPVLKAPSESSEELVKQQIQGLLKNPNELRHLEELKKTEGVASVVEEKPRKRKRKSGPNPLSCKKKKKKIDNSKEDVKKVSSGPGNSTKKRKRKRIRLPEHVKKELASIANK